MLLIRLVWTYPLYTESQPDGARAMSGTGIAFVGLLKSALKEKDISDDIAIFTVSFINKTYAQNP